LRVKCNFAPLLGGVRGTPVVGEPLRSNLADLSEAKFALAAFVEDNFYGFVLDDRLDNRARPVTYVRR
jgi:hypothetical protein